MSIGSKIKHYRELAGMTQDDVAKVLKLSPQAIYKYEKDIVSNIPIDKIRQLAELFNISPNALTGWDDGIIKDGYLEVDRNGKDGWREYDLSEALDAHKNILPLPKTKKIPLLGTIACGTPIFAEENIEGYLNAPENVLADFCLRCEGNSMINARINDGDIVYIRQQPDVDNGEIAAVLIDDSATLKRIYKYTDKIVLQPENPAFEPFVYVGSEIEQVRIIGKAVAFLSTVK